MTLKVQVGPPQIAIHQGQTALISEEDGRIIWPSEKGLYFFDTRVVSACGALQRPRRTVHGSKHATSIFRPTGSGVSLLRPPTNASCDPNAWERAI
jgi:hypothetical protein